MPSFISKVRVALGRANSRMKDVYDVWILTRFYALDPDRTARALAATFFRRGTALPDTLPDALTAAFAADPSKQRQWTAFTTDLAVSQMSLAQIVDDLASSLMPTVERASLNREPGDNHGIGLILYREHSGIIGEYALCKSAL